MSAVGHPVPTHSFVTGGSLAQHLALAAAVGIGPDLADPGRS
jgi:hypothetical protein